MGLSGAPVDKARLRSLLPLLAHRGPDEARVCAQDDVGFGHTRLSILGIANPKAVQPVVESGDMLTFNGEIYNFQELAERLKSDDVRVSGGSDTEVLFLCLRYWGLERTLRALDGMFAFAWYSRSEKVLTLARDPLGEKPLYFARGTGRIWFASEIKVILAAGDVSDAPNLGRVDDFLYTAKVNGSETMFRDVHEVEPGSFVRLDGAGNTKVARYWSPEDPFVHGAFTPSTTTAAETREKLSDAVQSRRISDVPIGVFLSGGLDSTSIFRLMVEAEPSEHYELFFSANRNPEVSEQSDVQEFMKYMAAVWPKGSWRLNQDVTDFRAFFDRLFELAWYYDEPVQFYNSPLFSRLCGMAHAKGLKVLLSGEGSDEIFWGYERFLRAAKYLDGSTDRGQALRTHYYGGGQHSIDVVKALTDGVADGAEATAPWQWLERNIGLPPKLLTAIYSQRYRLQMLLQRQDRVGMANSVEIRVPFLRPTLVRWANSLADQHKISVGDGVTKVCLRQAMDGRLPERILTKKKDGFPSDMMVWLRQPVMRPVAEALITGRDSFSMSYLDGAVARRVVADHFEGRRRLDTLVWNLMSLEIWHRVCRVGGAGANWTPDRALSRAVSEADLAVRIPELPI